MERTNEALPGKIRDELLPYKEHYEELKLILDRAFDQITIADGKGRFLMVSKNCEVVFGVPPGVFVGKTAQELEDEGIVTPSITLKVLKSLKTETIVQDSRSGRRLMVTGIPMFDEKGTLIRIVNISRDITEIKNLNQQLRDTEEILGWFRNELLRVRVTERGYIRTNSVAVEKILHLVNHVSKAPVTVLLLGETGVGKGVFAKLIHQISERRDGPFIQVNCGAIPKDLLESELFGYVKGAFTGASESGKKGLFEVANQGTMFLDEIAEMALELQVKLLTVLQENKIFKIGSTTPTEVNARIIAATNRDLKKLVTEGRFREDLYYRLNVVPIYVPALRNRSEDIPSFIHYFLNRFNIKYCVSRQISPGAYESLCSYDWPGNVRELENTIERLVITCDQPVIETLHVQDITKPDANSEPRNLDIVPLKQALKEIERQLLLKAYRKHRTTRKMAAVLEIDQSTIVKKISKLRAEGLWKN